MNLPRIHLYREPAAPELDFEALRGYLAARLPGAAVELREPFFDRFLPPEPAREEARDALALGLAQAKVRDPRKREDDFPPLYGEIGFERRRLENPASPVYGILYDAPKVMELCRELLPREERNLSHLHIVFTNQLMGTWDEGDLRYHARTGVYGFPCLISVNGLVEAPAKPREYYLLKSQYAALKMDDAVAAGLDPMFAGRYLARGDARFTEVAQGYLLQSLFFHLTGDPFCEDKGCRLYNAHWQEEMLQAQLGGPPELCPRHQAVLDSWRGRA